MAVTTMIKLFCKGIVTLNTGAHKDFSFRIFIMSGITSCSKMQIFQQSELLIFRF